MSADSTLVLYGIRFETGDEQRPGLESRTDPRIRTARDHQLAHWWGNFSVDEINEQSYLFIGTLLGHVGHEGVYELRLGDSELSSTMLQTKQKLSTAGFEGEPSLFIQFEPDY